MGSAAEFQNSVSCAGSASRGNRTSVLGCPVDNLTMRETVDVAIQAMRTGNRVRQVSLNVAKLVNMKSDPVLHADVVTSDVINADGAGVLLAGWCTGTPLKERVAGIDLFQELLKACAADGFRPFFLGATPEVLREAEANALDEFPSLRFAGLRSGYFTREEEPRLLEEINNSRADCLFIGMPTPRKERWLAAYRDRLSVPFAMGVGGSFDILAGRVQRAPIVWQKIGFEWFYRVIQEPRRMWWRYTRTNFLFAGMLCAGIVKARRRV
jgi:N-acetylglucosaminyldiphosphoundecaprenol N-acetyl-beta-D-mannosaminyltransferase